MANVQQKIDGSKLRTDINRVGNGIDKGGVEVVRLARDAMQHGDENNGNFSLAAHLLTKLPDAARAPTARIYKVLKPGITLSKRDVTKMKNPKREPHFNVTADKKKLKPPHNHAADVVNALIDNRIGIFDRRFRDELKKLEPVAEDNRTRQEKIDAARERLYKYAEKLVDDDELDLTPAAIVAMVQEWAKAKREAEKVNKAA